MSLARILLFLSLASVIGCQQSTLPYVKGLATYEQVMRSAVASSGSGEHATRQNRESLEPARPAFLIDYPSVDLSIQRAAFVSHEAIREGWSDETAESCAGRALTRDDLEQIFDAAEVVATTEYVHDFRHSPCMAQASVVDKEGNPTTVWIDLKYKTGIGVTRSESSGIISTIACRKCAWRSLKQEQQTRDQSTQHDHTGT